MHIVLYIALGIVVGFLALGFIAEFLGEIMTGLGVIIFLIVVVAIFSVPEARNIVAIVVAILGGGFFILCLIRFKPPNGLIEADVTAEWMRKAELGDVAAQSNLGYIYNLGVGVTKDLVQAHVWWSIAAANGCISVKENLESIEEEMTLEQKAKAEKLASEFFGKPPMSNLCAPPQFNFIYKIRKWATDALIKLGFS
jgi:hypothetical protein